MHLLDQSVFLKTLGWALLNSLWQMAVLLLCYMVVTAGGRRFSARVRHLVALSLLGAGFSWAMLSLIFPLFNTAWFAFVTSNQQISTLVSFIRKFTALAMPYCSTVYLAILFFQFARYSIYYMQTRRLGETGIHKPEPGLRIFTDMVCRQLGIRKTVNVWLSSAADSPMTVGFMKSIILIALATINHLTTTQVEAILLHELAHIRRHDFLLNLLVTVTGILFFFNPFARLLIKNIRKEAENSCDDLVMQFRYDPYVYVSALLSLEKTRYGHQLAMAAVGKNSNALLERVRRITGFKQRVSHSPYRLVFLSLLFLASILMIWPGLRQSTPKLFAYRYTSEKPGTKGALEIIPPYRMNITAGASSTQKKRSVIAPHRTVKTEERDGYSNDEQVYRTENISLVSDHITGDEDDEQSIAPAVAAINTVRDYSIAEYKPAPAPYPDVAASANFPFVPAASFDCKIIEDSITLLAAKLAFSKKIAAADLQNALDALETVDWKKITVALHSAYNKADAKAMQDKLRSTLLKIDLDKISEQAAAVVDESHILQLKTDILSGLRSLDNKEKSVSDLRKLQIKIGKDQIKLQQGIRKLQQPAKKKVVYI